jgi:hypothetical protein
MDLIGINEIITRAAFAYKTTEFMFRWPGQLTFVDTMGAFIS